MGLGPLGSKKWEKLGEIWVQMGENPSKTGLLCSSCAGCCWRLPVLGSFRPSPKWGKMGPFWSTRSHQDAPLLVPPLLVPPLFGSPPFWFPPFLVPPHFWFPPFWSPPPPPFNPFPPAGLSLAVITAAPPALCWFTTSPGQPPSAPPQNKTQPGSKIPFFPPKRQQGDLQRFDPLADGRADARQPQHRHHPLREQKGPGWGARGHLPGGLQIRAGERWGAGGDLWGWGSTSGGLRGMGRCLWGTSGGLLGFLWGGCGAQRDGEQEVAFLEASRFVQENSGGLQGLGGTYGALMGG